MYLSFKYSMPIVKQDITLMSVEQLAAYVESGREKNRIRSKRY